MIGLGESIMPVNRASPEPHHKGVNKETGKWRGQEVGLVLGGCRLLLSLSSSV